MSKSTPETMPMTDRGQHTIAPVWAWYGLVILILASTLANSITQVIALLTEVMKHDLNLTDTQIGTLRGIGTTLVVAIAGLPIAWLADRMDRRLIFAACILIWSVATALSGWSVNFETLFMCAVGISVGEAVLTPVVFSMLPDIFPRDRLVLVNSIFFITQLLGYAITLTVGGLLIDAVESARPLLPGAISGMANWRLTLMAIALPGLVIGPLMLTIPLRRKAKASKGPEVGREELWAFLLHHRRVLLSVFLGFGLISAANFTIFGWMAVAISRSFGQPPGEVGRHLGEAFAIGCVLGVLAANLGARWLLPRMQEIAMVRIGQVGALLALLLSCLYLFAQTPEHFYRIAIFQIAASFGCLTLSPTVTQLIAPARLRARVFAISHLIFIPAGAISPLLVGFVSDTLGASAHDLLLAILIVALPTFLVGIVALWLGESSLLATIAMVRADDERDIGKEVTHAA